MGDFRFTLEAAGGHCCQQEWQDNEDGTHRMREGDYYGCGLYSCPDCKARRMVEELAKMGYTIHTAKIEHWPADLAVNGFQHGYTEAGQVTDDLKAGIQHTEYGVYMGPAKRKRGK